MKSKHLNNTSRTPSPQERAEQRLSSEHFVFPPKTILCPRCLCHLSWEMYKEIKWGRDGQRIKVPVMPGDEVWGKMWCDDQVGQGCGLVLEALPWPLAALQVTPREQPKTKSRRKQSTS